MKHTGHTKNTENIGLIEDLRTEFKSDVKKLSEETIVEAVVALANTEGGTLYIGVEDDGTITGVHKYVEWTGITTTVKRGWHARKLPDVFT